MHLADLQPLESAELCKTKLLFLRKWGIYPNSPSLSTLKMDEFKPNAFANSDWTLFQKKFLVRRLKMFKRKDFEETCIMVKPLYWSTTTTGSRHCFPPAILSWEAPSSTELFNLQMHDSELVTAQISICSVASVFKGCSAGRTGWPWSSTVSKNCQPLSAVHLLVIH